MCPVGWTLRGIITSQLGNVESRLVGTGFDGTVKEYLEEKLGFEAGMEGVTVAVLIAFSLFFFGIYAISIKLFNFQKRWLHYRKMQACLYVPGLAEPWPAMICMMMDR